MRDRQAGTSERVSLSSTGEEGNAASGGTAISPDGRFVVFVSSADNLVPGDGNHYGDVFVRDRQTGTTERVNVTSNGTEANDESAAIAISADGRFVLFETRAASFLPSETARINHLFLRYRQQARPRW